jgi:hypothetical protein
MQKERWIALNRNQRKEVTEKNFRPALWDRYFDFVEKGGDRTIDQQFKEFYEMSSHLKRRANKSPPHPLVLPPTPPLLLQPPPPPQQQQQQQQTERPAAAASAAADSAAAGSSSSCGGCPRCSGRPAPNSAPGGGSGTVSDSEESGKVITREQCLLDDLSPEGLVKLQNGYTDPGHRFNKDWKTSQSQKAQGGERRVKQAATPEDIDKTDAIPFHRFFPSTANELGNETAWLISVWAELKEALTDAKQGRIIADEAMERLLNDIGVVVEKHEQEARAKGETEAESAEKREGRMALLVMRVASKVLRCLPTAPVSVSPKIHCLYRCLTALASYHLPFCADPLGLLQALSYIC